MRSWDDGLLLAAVFENFRNMCPKIYEPSQAFAWQAAFKKIKVKLDLLTDIDMLLMAKKGIRGEIWHFIYQYGKANNKCQKRLW